MTDVGVRTVIRRPALKGVRQSAPRGSFWLLLACVEVLLLSLNDLSVARSAGGVALVVSVTKDAVLGVFIVAAFPRLVRGLSRLSATVAILVVFALATSILAPTLGQGLYGFRSNYLGLLWLVVLPRLIRPNQACSILRWVSFSGQIAAFIAIATYRRGIGWLFELGVLPVAAGDPFPQSYFLAGSIRPRAFSPYAGPNELALGMMIVIVAGLCAEGLSLRFRLALCLLPAVALLQSGSRSGLLGTVVALMIVGVRALPPRAFTIRTAMVTIVLGIVMLGGVVYLRQASADPSLQGHRFSLVESMAKVASNPIGTGPGTAGPRARLYSEDAVLTESFFFLVALEMGAVGLALYVSVVIRVFDRLRSVRNSLTVTALAVLTGSLISQAVLPTLQSTSVAWLLWIVVGLGLTSISTRQKLVPRTPRSVGAPGVPNLKRLPNNWRVGDRETRGWS